MNRIFNNMMINTPNDVKRHECQKNNKFKQAFSFENVECKDKEHADGNKKKIVKWMFFYFVCNFFEKFHVLLENRAIDNDKGSDHHKSNKENVNEIFPCNMDKIEL